MRDDTFDALGRRWPYYAAYGGNPFTLHRNGILVFAATQQRLHTALKITPSKRSADATRQAYMESIVMLRENTFRLHRNNTFIRRRSGLFTLHHTIHTIS